MASQSKGPNNTVTQVSERFETDRAGVDTIELVVDIHQDDFPQQMLADFSPHPRFSTMALSKRSGQKINPQWYRVAYTFEGFLSGAPPDPTYELIGSLSQEPIQTHPDFATIAGTPAAPLNNALFVDPDTGWKSEKANAIWKEFSNTGGANRKAGLDSYLVPGAEWRETSFETSEPATLENLATIASPRGNPPSLAGYDWLVWGQTYQRRGYTYQVQTTWKFSGRNGWDPDIYS